MTIITPPAPLPLRNVKWRLPFPAQVNRSGWTGRRKVVGLPGAAMWTAQGEFVTQIGEATARRWRAFFASLRGPVNSFPLLATENAQFTLPAACSIYGDRPAGSTAITLLGPVGEPQLAAGTVLAVGGRVYVSSAASTPGGGINLRTVPLTTPLATYAGYGSPVIINAAGLYADAVAGATTLTIRGPIGERQFFAGELLTIADQLVVLTADSVAGGGTDQRVVTFATELRINVSAGTAIERVSPYALMSLTSDPPGWDVDVGQLYSFSLSCEEAL